MTVIKAYCGQNETIARLFFTELKTFLSHETPTYWERVMEMRATMKNSTLVFD